MKKIVFLLLSFIISMSFVSASDLEDTSIIDELEKQGVKELNVDFGLKSFKSCQDMEEVIGKYIKEYWKNNKGNSGYKRGINDVEYVTFEANSVDMAKSSISEDSIPGSGGGDEDYSKTNVQVEGVDESDIVKTDGDYIYYYNASQNYVYIINSSDKSDLQVVKKLKLPSYFSNPVLYISKNRLVIVATGYSYTTYKRNYWINRNNKTYTIVFDTTKKSSPDLLKIYVNDGNLTKSRKIGNYLYVVSNNYFNIPYYDFKEEDDIVFEAQDIVPRKIDISKTENKLKQNLKLSGKVAPYNVKAGSVAKCNEIEYVLPDEETLKKYDFSPSYNIISIINIDDTEREVKTKVIAGSNSEIYMSLENLYLTSYMYQPYNYRCPVDTMCIAPFYYGGRANTLLHKLSIDANSLNYEDSTIVPGQPLNQYSMDEKDSYFRIITSARHPEKTTDLYILDKDLSLVSSLNGLGKGEDFKSSRFMGDKLYLVTFEQIDPLFAIDLSDMKKPEVLGELKIPGYSTYLHPYDDNHLIGIGYDTYENEWGGTSNGGIKVDLYQINFDKKCGDSDLTKQEEDKCESGDYKGIIVKQLYSKALGDSGSYSEAQHNPRMFMWNSNKNLLLLPATVYTNESKTSYKHIDFFNGLIALAINKDFGINEKYKISHIDTEGLEEKRTEECKKYSAEEECRKLIDGSTYCKPVSSYIPEYCYLDSPIGSYISAKSWNFREEFIKRALWIGDTSFAISDDHISSHSLTDGEFYAEVEMK